MTIVMMGNYNIGNVEFDEDYDIYNDHDDDD